MENDSLKKFINEANSMEIKLGLKTADEITELICFHARCRKNGEAMMQPWVLLKRKT